MGGLGVSLRMEPTKPNRAPRKATDNLGAQSPPSSSAVCRLLMWSQVASFPNPGLPRARLVGFTFQADVGGLPGGDGPALSSGSSQLGGGDRLQLQGQVLHDTGQRNREWVIRKGKSLSCDITGGWNFERPRREGVAP